MFSANLVVEDNLPLADYFETADGRDNDKMNVAVEWEKGTVLTVPILCSISISFKLEVDNGIATGEHDEIVLMCRIRNTLKDEKLVNSSMTSEEIKLQQQYEPALIMTIGDGMDAILANGTRGQRKLSLM